METEGEAKAVEAKAGPKKEVKFVELEEPPKAPPRLRKKRLSKARRGGSLTAPTEVDEDSPKSQESLSDLELPESRLPELLRRDTFCDALDFKSYSLNRFPGRRASSLEALWRDGEAAEGLSKSAEELSAGPPRPSIAESKSRWLKDVLQEEASPPEENNNKAVIPALVVTAEELVAGAAAMKPVEPRRPYHVVYASPQKDSSRKSSMTESLQEFESSIYDMLKAQPQESEDEDTRVKH